MAKNISLLGADYPGVPAVQLPQTGGGTVTFYDLDELIHDVSDSTSVTYTAGNTWTKAAKSISIPAGAAYMINAQQLYSTVSPGGIMIGFDSTHAFGVQSDSRCASISGYATEPTTLYIWAKGSEAGTNSITINGCYIKT